jgi:hypothetical protein
MFVGVHSLVLIQVGKTNIDDIQSCAFNSLTDDKQSELSIEHES